MYRDRPGNQDGPLPPVQLGQRETRRLSRRAARQVKGACVKAASEGRPLVSFWTATFGPEARERVAGGALIPGAEVKRLIRALRVWAKRKGLRPPVFVWVAENPHDENPHVHLLTDLVIPRADFRSFAAYLEDLWGHGMVHMERIKHPYAAGAYMLKAVNYVSKGAETADQGKVYGNRYGISQAIRCKEVVTVLDGTEAEATVLRDWLVDSARVERDGALVSPFGLWRGEGGLDRALRTVETLGDVARERVRPIV